MLPKGVALVGEEGAAWSNVEKGLGVACGNWNMVWEITGRVVPDVGGNDRKRSWHRMGRVS